MRVPVGDTRCREGVGRCSGAGWVHNRHVRSVGKPAARKSSDTLLGFETTSPCPLVWGWPRVGGVGWLSPCFGGGVWCLICG